MEKGRISASEAVKKLTALSPDNLEFSEYSMLLHGCEYKGLYGKPLLCEEDVPYLPELKRLLAEHLHSEDFAFSCSSFILRKEDGEVDRRPTQEELDIIRSAYPEIQTDESVTCYHMSRNRGIRVDMLDLSPDEEHRITFADLLQHETPLPANTYLAACDYDIGILPVGGFPPCTLSDRFQKKWAPILNATITRIQDGGYGRDILLKTEGIDSRMLQAFPFEILNLKPDVTDEESETVIKLACYAGELIERKMIRFEHWEDLEAAIADVINEYYDHPERKQLIYVPAKRIFLERFGLEPDSAQKNSPPLDEFALSLACYVGHLEGIKKIKLPDDEADEALSSLIQNVLAAYDADVFVECFGLIERLALKQYAITPEPEKPPTMEM